jgi:hypothetical protein
VVDVDSPGSDVKTGENDGDDRTNSEFTHLGPVTIDDFDRPDLVLPFDFGSPSQWERDFSSNSQAGTHSLTNIPTAGLGATADLILRIHVDNPSTMSCTARVDTSMPFEFFLVIDNGNQLNTYHKVQQGRVTILIGIVPGDHTVVFRVKNNEFNPGVERVVSGFGTGRVWLDECEVRSTGGLVTEKGELKVQDELSEEILSDTATVTTDASSPKEDGSTFTTKLDPTPEKNDLLDPTVTFTNSTTSVDILDGEVTADLPTMTAICECHLQVYRYACFFVF